MYSTVSVRIGISWCVQYCVSKYRDLLLYGFYCFPTVSDAFILFLMFFYRFRMQKHYIGIGLQTLQVEEAESPLCGANDHCTSPIHVPYGHGIGHGNDRVKTVSCVYIMTVKA